MSEFKGYRRFLKTMLVKALRNVFDAGYPNADFRNVNIDIEYPVQSQHYPAIWVGYDDDAPVTTAGIAHREFHPDGSGGWKQVTRRRFEGYFSLTTIALTSQERDALYDEVVAVLSFSELNPTIREFRRYIEVDNDLIAANIDFDTFEPRGENAVPGTPWGTDEFLYECGISVRVLGEFVSDDFDGTLVTLSKVTFAPEESLTPLSNVPPDSDDGWI